tara:strand:- start:1768 stop:1962 length:195 start_codon:yes stop_codon:yes gene_type:complete
VYKLWEGLDASDSVKVACRKEAEEDASRYEAEMVEWKAYQEQQAAAGAAAGGGGKAGGKKGRKG